MNDEEFESFLTNHRRARDEEERRELQANASVIEEFVRYAETKGVSLTKSNFSYTPITGVLASSPGMTSKLLHGIETERDGLYAFKTLTKHFKFLPFPAGLLRNAHFAVLAHPHFRRNYHGLNNYAPYFIDLFWRFDDQSVSKYIALDEDRVRVVFDDRVYLERDTWFGAPFSDDVVTIPNGITKLRPPVDIERSYVSFFSQTPTA